MMTVPAATPCDLQSAHQVTAACPLRCLQASLTAAQIRAALARHAGLTPARTEKKEHPHMTSPAAVTGPAETEAARAGTAARIDALDLEPIAFKLMHPEAGQTVMTLAEADQRVTLYRSYLKLCAWYPHDDIVPSGVIDDVWHTHILDTGKYAADSTAALGYFLNHFPYFGMRGEADVAAWQAAYARTRELFRQHFGIELTGGAGESCHNGGSDCNTGGSICSFCSDRECDKSALDTASDSRPRPDRAALAVA
jgi:hypothetical protein